MSESERRRKYRYDRILIESTRILSAQFDDAVVYLTGAQLELLRNVAQYLRRLETYVSEYNPGYYLAPTAEDYDDILAIVANLEEKLMGNPNTIWGYNDVKRQSNSDTVSGAGTHVLWLGSCPSGLLWKYETVVCKNLDTSCSLIEMFTNSSAGDLVFLESVSPAAGELVVWQGSLLLRQGESLWFRFNGCADGDDIECTATGYSMVVP